MVTSVCAVSATVMAAAACGSSAGSGGGGAATGPQSSAKGMAAVCPNPIQIATDWMPEAEQGAYYQLAASGGTINKDQKTYTAPLINPFTNKPAGVNVELIAGGPALGNLQTPEVLQQQPNILMGADDLDTLIADSSSAPVVGIVAPFTNSLHIILWNPATHNFSGFSDLKKSGMTVLYFKGTEFIDYMAGAGYLDQSQLDGSYTGSPARFVASNGGVAEQGFATAEPFEYTHETAAWNKATAYELTSNTGYNPYSEMGETTQQNLQQYSACFKQLVPMIQQSQINFVLHPARVNNLIVQLNSAYGEIGGNYDMGVANYAVKTLLGDKIVAQPSTGAFGSFDPSRVKQLLNQLQPVLASSHQSIASGDTANSFYTNKFIDNSINFTGYSGPYNDTKGVITVPGSK